MADGFRILAPAKFSRPNRSAKTRNINPRSHLLGFENWSQRDPTARRATTRRRDAYPLILRQFPARRFGFFSKRDAGASLVIPNKVGISKSASYFEPLGHEGGQTTRSRCVQVE